MKIDWKYAIGEIIIVIIGISIAFALNSWKEEQTNQKQKRQYLENLVLDINKEIEKLENNQEVFKTKRNHINLIRPLLGNPKVRRDTILPKFFNLVRLANFTPENTTYQTLINSGDMKLIDDFQLRRKIEEHYAAHKQVMQAYKRIENINEKYIADFFVYKMDYDNMAKGNFDFLDDPLIKNIIQSLEGSFSIVLASNGECIKSNKNLLNAIKKSLE